MAAPGYEAMIGRPLRSDHPAARLMGSFLGSLRPVVSSLDVAARDSVRAVIQRRLSRCRADVLRGTDESATAIAPRWGFRNISFFSRLFRDRYGVTARELQMAARAAARPQM